jgi:hypothetical protein
MKLSNLIPSFQKSRPFLGLMTAALLATPWTLIACAGDDAANDFFHSPDSETIRMTVRTSIPLAYVANAAMAAVNGHAPPDTSVSNTCGAFPCTALVTVDNLESGLPFTLADHAVSAVAAGLWSSAGAAVLTVSFLESPVGTETYRVTKVSTFPVVESLWGGYKIVYADLDVNIAQEPGDSIDLTDEQVQAEYDRAQVTVSDDPEINLSMDAWVIEIDHNDSPDDANDDRFLINGGGQYLYTTQASADVVQLGMAGTEVSWDCAANPTQGLAVMSELEVDSGNNDPPTVIANALIRFHDRCYQRADVVAATGNWFFATGDTIPLNLNAP